MYTICQSWRDDLERVTLQGLMCLIVLLQENMSWVAKRMVGIFSLVILPKCQISEVKGGWHFFFSFLFSLLISDGPSLLMWLKSSSRNSTDPSYYTYLSRANISVFFFFNLFYISESEEYWFSICDNMVFPSSHILKDLF